eukprot:30818-Pelagococcus_subviridis.AAC.2
MTGWRPAFFRHGMREILIASRVPARLTSEGADRARRRRSVASLETPEVAVRLSERGVGRRVGGRRPASAGESRTADLSLDEGFGS